MCIKVPFGAVALATSPWLGERAAGALSLAELGACTVKLKRGFLARAGNVVVRTRYRVPCARKEAASMHGTCHGGKHAHEHVRRSCT